MRGRREPIRWPAWRYGPNGAKGIFESPEDVPEGWTSKVYVPEVVIPIKSTELLDRDELVLKLGQMGVDINPTWGHAHMKRIIDGDISSTR